MAAGPALDVGLIAIAAYTIALVWGTTSGVSTRRYLGFGRAEPVRRNSWLFGLFWFATAVLFIVGYWLHWQESDKSKNNTLRIVTRWLLFTVPLFWAASYRAFWGRGQTHPRGDSRRFAASWWLLFLAFVLLVASTVMIAIIAGGNSGSMNIGWTTFILIILPTLGTIYPLVIVGYYWSAVQGQRNPKQVGYRLNDAPVDFDAGHFAAVPTIDRTPVGDSNVAPCKRPINVRSFPPPNKPAVPSKPALSPRGVVQQAPGQSGGMGHAFAGAPSSQNDMAHAAAQALLLGEHYKSGRRHRGRHSGY